MQIDVTGGDAQLERVLKSASLTATVPDSANPAPMDYVAAARADYRRLLTGLYAEGYYGGTISITVDGREAATIAPLDAPAHIGTVQITVTPGPRFSFGQVAISPLPADTTLPADFATGQTARSETIRTAVSDGLDAWRAAGHALAKTGAQKITADHKTDTLDVAVTLAPGPVLTFGKLAVTGNQAVSAARIAEIAGLPDGQIYDPADIDRAAQRLRRTGAFRSVAVVPADAAGPGDTLPVTAQVIEEKRHRLGFGIELSSVDGLALSTFWLNRNLLGGAESLRIDGKVSNIGGTSGGTDYSLSAAFNRPRTFHVDTDLYATASIMRKDETDYLLDQASISVGLTRLIGNDLTLSGGAALTTAKVDDALGARSYSVFSLPITGTRDKRDDKLNPKNGTYLDLEITPFVGTGSIGSGGRLYADGRIYHSFGQSHPVTFALRGQVGSVLGPDVTETPTDMLFYSGGTQTVRGQPYQGLGVTVTRDLGMGPVSLDLGGMSYAGVQAEARVGITGAIGLVGFYDVGYVGASSTPLTDGSWQAGAGLGVRYDTGIGPIRLDLAVPVSGDGAGHNLQVYLGIGQAF
ncbi:autotransporter assembly complex family protein [Limimaricola sp.]|uniref:autotransporter assembly complex protein TamA n=1 Tax=Limimaricola sp. TaxID=2211665 RepID=UPI0025C19921|nr:autotransporter assembly complex family protein [Limimaricola sp.]